MFGWSLLGILLIAVVTLLLARFVFNKQVEAYLCNSLKNEMVDKLKDAGKYIPDTTSYNFAYQQDTANHKKSENISNSIQLYHPQSLHGTRLFHWHVLLQKTFRMPIKRLILRDVTQ